MKFDTPVTYTYEMDDRHCNTMWRYTPPVLGKMSITCMKCSTGMGYQQIMIHCYTTKGRYSHPVLGADSSIALSIAIKLV